MICPLLRLKIGLKILKTLKMSLKTLKRGSRPLGWASNIFPTPGIHLNKGLLDDLAPFVTKMDTRGWEDI
jgi:hypothetical protein